MGKKPGGNKRREKRSGNEEKRPGGNLKKKRTRAPTARNSGRAKKPLLKVGIS